MTAVLDPDVLTGFHDGPVYYSAEDGRFYLLTDDGAIPADGPRYATTLDAAQLSMCGADHFTLRSDGTVDMMRPASPYTAAYEDTIMGMHFPGGLGLMGASGSSSLRKRLALNFLSGGSLDPRITFTRASSATRVNSSGLIETVSTNAPRFDYDPVTLAAKGLLIEEQRTNLLTYSNTLSDVNWVKTNITIGAAITGPDGAASLAKVEATTTSSTLMYKVVSAAGSASGNAYSIYAKKGSGATEANSFILRNSTTATNLVVLAINYDTGDLYYTVGSGPATAVNCGNGIWRIPITATSGIGAGDDLFVYAGFTGPSAAAGTHAYIGFAQLEAGSFATSYIPTTSATVTRAADVASITGTNFSDWYNPVEGTFLIQLVPKGLPSSSARYLEASIAGAAIRTPLLYATGAGVLAVATVVNASVTQATLSHSGAFAIGSRLKHAAAYKTDDFASVANGGAPQTDASGTIGLPDRLTIGWATSSPADIFNGWIERLTYYPARLSNALLQTLST